MQNLNLKEEREDLAIQLAIVYGMLITLMLPIIIIALISPQPTPGHEHPGTWLMLLLAYPSAMFGITIGAVVKVWQLGRQEIPGKQAPQ